MNPDDISKKPHITTKLPEEIREIILAAKEVMMLVNIPLETKNRLQKIVCEKIECVMEKYL